MVASLYSWSRDLILFVAGTIVSDRLAPIYFVGSLV